MKQGALLVVAAALIRRDQVLVQQRPHNKQMAGLWEFPGGKIEPGETPTSALVRELAEELAIEVTPGDLTPLAFGTDEGGGRPLVLLLYRTERWTGEPRALETPELRWVDGNALRQLQMPPADVPLVDALVRRWEVEARAGIEPACKDLQSSA